VHDTSVPVDHGRISVWYRPAIPGKPTVLLIHGLTGTSRWWSPVIARLPEEVGVIAPDLRGRGQSWETPGPYDLSSMAADLSHCLNHFEIPTATIAGYSMGAWMATVYGTTRHRRVKALVLVDGGVRVEVGAHSDQDAVINMMFGSSMNRLEMTFDSEDAYLQHWRNHPALAGRWTAQLDRVFDYDIEPGWRGGYQVRANRKAVAAGATDILFDEQTIKAVNELVMPTRLLIVDHGMLDERGGFVSDANAADAASRNPNLSVEKLRDLNHFTVLLGAGANQVASAIVRML
jgi:pimeloyl-ACP methyl ester carboxylesterase